MNANLLAEFRNCLDAEEQLAAIELQRDSTGLLIKSAISEFDWFSYFVKTNENPTPEMREQFYLMRLGICRLIKLILDGRASFDFPIVLAVRQKTLSDYTLKFLAALGFIEHGRRIADSLAMGLGDLKKKNDKVFEVRLPPQIKDAAFYENTVLEHYRTQHDLRNDELHKSKEAKALLAAVKQHLTDNVRVWREHFIGYSAHPILDDYFFTEAYSKLISEEGFDTFHWSLRFGGIQFQQYLLGQVFLTSLALKHRYFCEALVTKDPQIKFYNILTITSDKQGMVRSLQQAINDYGRRFEGHAEITIEEANSILTVLSIGRGRTELLSRSLTPLPYLVEVSETGLIRSVAGAEIAPISFLLSSLSYHFPKDYSRNQRTREGVLQRAITKEMRRSFADLQFRENVKLKMNGRDLTDIDYTIYDPRTQTVMLCQLKSQDLYGVNIRERYTKASRLRREIEQWLTVVKSWVSKNGENSIRAALRLHKGQHITNVRYLVIAKHSAHSLDIFGSQADFAYANWIQFYNALRFMDQTQGSIKTLPGLFSILRKHIAEAKDQMYLQEPDNVYHLPNLSFRVFTDNSK